MNLREFSSFGAMSERVAALVGAHARRRCAAPHAILLAGGTTPAAAYEAAAADPRPVSRNLRVMLSDERMVPADSPESNLGRIACLIAAWKLGPDSVIRVQTELSLDDAAGDYDGKIAAFFAAGGSLTLALLGLGADGHTASLFNAADLDAARGRHAVPVRREIGPDRVSVTPQVLARAERVVFVAAGRAKEAVVRRLGDDSGSVTAGSAVREAGHVELWFAPD